MAHKNSDTSSSIWRKLWSADSRGVVADVVVVIVVAAVDVVVAADSRYGGPKEIN